MDLLMPGVKDETGVIIDEVLPGPALVVRPVSTGHPGAATMSDVLGVHGSPRTEKSASALSQLYFGIY
jgi:hypothetical protein